MSETARHSKLIKESKNGADQLWRSEKAQNFADVLVLFLVSLTALWVMSVMLTQLRNIFSHAATNVHAGS